MSGKIACGVGLNILLGENGQGKTNWLEAIYFLATTHSFRTSRLSEAIRFGETTAIVTGQVRQSEEITRELRAIVEGNAKAFLVNGNAKLFNGI